MDDTTRRENEQFENEVQRIARALWPHAEFSGATTLGGREIDGVFETEDRTHVVEATTSRKRQKAQQDVEKLNLSLTKIQARREFHPVRGWFVTRDEPTADQRTITYKYRDRIRVLSFSQFQARLIESKTYLSARDDYAFGSVRDPATGAHDPRVQYVGLDLEDVSSQRVVPRKDLLSLLDSGRTVVLLGDYGAGKSMTLREVYRDLRARHLRGQSSTFPVYLNLRDHYGQTDPAEVIERHGKSIGFSHPSHLVRAWRAGYVHLLIDGFDEISTMNIQGLWRQLRDSRFRAMGAVRRMIREHTEHSRRAGLLVAGRAHFFDSPTELRKALGLAPNTKELLLSEFTAEQIATYLENAGLAVFVPSWLPSRPLLVGYLAAHGLLDDLANGESGAQHVEPAVGWHTLIDRVTVREAEIEPGIDGSTVRRILERLATKARASQGGLGSLSPDSVVQAFSDICGYSPDERGMVLLQRLPGLGVDREEENSRTFVDEAFADACRAGDLVRFIENPFGEDQSELADMTSSIGQLGIQVTAHRAAKEQFTEGKINAALASARRSKHRYIVADLARLLLKISHKLASTRSVLLRALPVQLIQRRLC